MDAYQKFVNECKSLAGSRARLMEKPRKSEADLALPCFSLSKNPVEEAKRLAAQMGKKRKIMIKKIEATGPYVNFYINEKKFSPLIIKQILKERKLYGSEKNRKTIVIDYCGVNTAKPMSIGHLRSTIIGQCLYNLYSFLGYKCIGDNHIGDWGTQFGKLIYAYNSWADKNNFKKNPVREMLRLYVKFHDEAENNEELEKEGRKWYKKLEDGDKEALKIWKLFTEESNKEFSKIYKILGVKFDYQLGESFYNEEAKEIIKYALKKTAKKEQGALIIEFDNMPPLIIQKSDGATLYSTKDLACIKYRKIMFRPEKIIYVVGSEQNLYFKQVFAAAAKMKIMKKDDAVHVNFGLVRMPEGRMSTRKGRVIFLDTLIKNTIEYAEKIINEKNPKISDKKNVAEKIAIAAIKYSDLSKDRIHTINFDWKTAMSFEGNTGPYLQYTHARACSVLRKSKKKPKAGNYSKEENSIIKKLSVFNEVLGKAAKEYKPNLIANYLYELATLFNEYYHRQRIIGSIDEESKIALVKSLQIVLENGLRLLGIEALERM